MEDRSSWDYTSNILRQGLTDTYSTTKHLMRLAAVWYVQLAMPIRMHSCCLYVFVFSCRLLLVLKATLLAVTDPITAGHKPSRLMDPRANLISSLWPEGLKHSTEKHRQQAWPLLTPRWAQRHPRQGRSSMWWQPVPKNPKTLDPTIQPTTLNPKLLTPKP